MKNIGTKSVNMSDIMVYLAMFNTTFGPVPKFPCFVVWKVSLKQILQRLEELMEDPTSSRFANN